MTHEPCVRRVFTAKLVYVNKVCLCDSLGETERVPVGLWGDATGNLLHETDEKSTFFMRQKKRKQEGGICGSERQSEGDQPAAFPSCSSLN